MESLTSRCKLMLSRRPHLIKEVYTVMKEILCFYKVRHTNERCENDINKCIE
jgi:hypothetical protein